MYQGCRRRMVIMNGKDIKEQTKGQKNKKKKKTQTSKYHNHERGRLKTSPATGETLKYPWSLRSHCRRQAQPSLQLSRETADRQTWTVC